MTGPLFALFEFELMLAALVCEFVLAFELALEFGIGWQALFAKTSSTPSTNTIVDVFRELRIVGIVDLCFGGLLKADIRQTSGGSKPRIACEALQRKSTGNRRDDGVSTGSGRDRVQFRRPVATASGSDLIESLDTPRIQNHLTP